MLERRQRQSRYATPANLNGWLLLGGAAALAVIVFLFTRDGCDNEFAEVLRLRMVKVDTWAEWQEHLAGTDLYLKYRAFNVAYEPDSIRADFVRHFPLSVLAVPSSSPPRIWNEGTTLHVSSILTDSECAAITIFFKDLTKREWMNLPEEEYFIHATIASLFQEAAVHAPNGKITRIPLPFIYGQ